MTRVEDWDTSAWPTWTVTGRVLPERCDVNVPNRAVHAIGALGRVQLRKMQVIRSHIVAVCALEKHDPSVGELADIVRTALWFPIDYIAYQNQGAYEMVLDLCLNNQTGDVLAIPINETTFEAAVGRPSADTDGDAAACCDGCAGLGGPAACLPQAANRRRVKAGSTKYRAGWDLSESVDIQFLLNPGSITD